MLSSWLMVVIQISWAVSSRASRSQTAYLTLAYFYANTLKQKVVASSFTSAPSAATSGVAPTQYMLAKTMTVSRGIPLLYENGYEEPQIIDGVGPFTFEKHAYEAAINDAAAF